MTCIANENDIKQLLERSNLFVRIFEQYGPPPDWQRPQGFITLSGIILEQQVSLESAKAHFKKLNKYLTEFTPDKILELSDEEMRNCQVTRQKASYLRALSVAIINKSIDFESFSNYSLQEVRQQLKTIKGIGDWTSDIYLIFCMQAKDIFPSGDVALIKTIKELSNTQTKEEIDLLTESWKPLRSLAAFFLWHYYLCKRNRFVIY